MASKNYKGAPFGTQTARFVVAGIHPQSKMPGTFTQVPYCKKSLKWSGLAPGCYNINVRDSFNEKEVSNRAAGPGWERQYHVAQIAKMPHLLHRPEAKRREERIRRLAPGTYNHTGFVEKLETKPTSIRGVCASTGKRFTQFTEETPGPGTYGIGGVPSAAMENSSTQSPGNVGMLDSGKSIKRGLQLVGCDLSPTRYNKSTFTEQILNKVVSKRGPYDLFTGNRAKPIMTGHLAVIPASAILGPGSYNLPSFTNDWESEWKVKHGKFSKMHSEGDDIRTLTGGERLNCCTLAQCPRSPREPGPGQYSPKVFSVNVEMQKENAPSFGSSANRYRVVKQPNAIGAGRYNIMKNSGCDSRRTNGAKWVFKSSTDRFVGHGRQVYLKERIRPKDVKPTDRVKGGGHGRATLKFSKAN